MNTNGGGLSYTHTGMYGIFTIIEATRQLRGECGPRQVPGATVGICHGNRRAWSAAATPDRVDGAMTAVGASRPPPRVIATMRRRGDCQVATGVLGKGGWARTAFVSICASVTSSRTATIRSGAKVRSKKK